MARTPSYDDLWAAGDVLRTRLSGLVESVESAAELVHDIRAWQRRCAWVVVVRGPLEVAAFRVATGPLQHRWASGCRPRDGASALTTRS